MIKYLQWLSGIIILAAVILNASAVVSRYVFNLSFVWSDETLVFANIAAVVVGATVAAFGGEHLSIDILRARLSDRAEKTRAVAVELLTLVVLGTAAWASTRALSVVGRSGQVSVAAGLPMWVPHGALFLSFLSLACIAAYRLSLLAGAGKRP